MLIDQGEAGEFDPLSCENVIGSSTLSIKINRNAAPAKM
jgi:hypothetical protein